MRKLLAILTIFSKSYLIDIWQGPKYDFLSHQSYKHILKVSN